VLTTAALLNRAGTRHQTGAPRVVVTASATLVALSI